MLNVLIIFLIRLKLGVKTHEHFQFDNQKSKYDKYFFFKRSLMKIEYDGAGIFHTIRYANVSLNWLLNDECKIKKVD